MTKKLLFTKAFLVAIVAVIALTTPIAKVEAHESHTYEINGIEYEIVVGSLNEPVFVDDKTGVSFEIARNGVALENAQQTLKAELIAGDTRKEVELSPVHGVLGQYKSNFIATIPTTLEYRLFGELEGTPFDVTYTCNPAGHPRAPEDAARTEISDDVIQTHKTGAFGCPVEKAEMGFPEPVQSDYELGTQLAEQGVTLEAVRTDAPAASVVYLSVILSILAFAFAWRNRPRRFDS